ncbi:MAG TPA: pyridoxal phosphate-dependent aminotransferase [Bacillota bacterium]|jgi:aspartate aminotransferase|nr:pyridoxal phosphate-dependent aminotransferase [Fastidiosipila sp.]HPX93041.1 pyridoxal phosphate-dependent aminotransferase [Bacillota bacterium]HQB80886.1 pyridoxal phosphate-dependent aminotransferase [Bacillota bacterium]
MISDRIRQMTPSQTLELNSKIAQLRKEGKNIIALNSGEPDFNTPQPIIEAAYQAMLEGKTKYTQTPGIPELREAIARKLLQENKVSYSADEILVSTGAKYALTNTFLALCNPGDEVIIPKPCWVSYVEMVKLAGAVPVLVPVKENNCLDPHAVKDALTPKTKVILINSPNNPTGAVYPRDSLMAVAELALRHDIYIVTDEVYEKLIYGTSPHISIASLSPEIKARTVTINAFSKAYAMTGWRLGYAAGPRQIIKALSAIQGHTTSNATSFVQWAAITALESCDPYVEEMRGAFEQRRDYLYGRVSGLPGIRCPFPEGAFYLFPDVSRLFGKSSGSRMIQDAPGLADYLLDEARVALVPGNAFEAPQAIRFTYSNSMENLIEAMDRIEEAISRLA